MTTGNDWDRRGHRLLGLAEIPSAVDWAGDWLLAEPESADATTLLGCACVVRALRPKAKADEAARARQACLAAARITPEDPTPWLALLLLAPGPRGRR
ncbi:Tetratricopeptide repeat-containing protein OS=Streptomyces microflavus OX=1919 GN=Smic_13310 PE=4 SV=1 [Streptomyces microflavus]